MNEGDLQAYLDGELDPVRARIVDQHLSGCAECRALHEGLRSAADELAVALAVLDMGVVGRPMPSPPRVGWRGGSSRFVRGSGRALSRAAAIILIFGGVALGALPGSPVRDWIGQVWRTGSVEGLSQEEAGVSILPVDGGVRVVISGEAGEGVQLRIRPVDARQLSLRWSGKGEDPHFRTGAGRVEVGLGDGGDILIEVPRAAKARIEVGDELFATVEGGEVRARVPGVAGEGGAFDFVIDDLGGVR